MSAVTDLQPDADTCSDVSTVADAYFLLLLGYYAPLAASSSDTEAGELSD